MISIHHAAAQPHPAAYRLAGQTLLVDRQLVALDHFAINITATLNRPTWTPAAAATGAHVTFDDKGWIGNAWRQVTCTADREGYYLQVADVGRFAVSIDGDHILRLRNEIPLDSQVYSETVLGAPLILALAAHNTWCLHAGAVLHDGQLILFLGESGQGKSTLARELPRLPGNEWRWAADDIVPAKLSFESLLGLPHFPQLKLPPGGQLDRGTPEALPIAAIYVLESAAPGAPAAVVPLSGQEAALALIRHTVAGRLFDQPTLARHLAFCTEAVRGLPIRRLSYPHRPQSVAAVASVLLSEIGTQSQRAKDQPSGY